MTHEPKSGRGPRANVLGLWTRALHISTLSSFAVAQPVLDLLSGQRDLLRRPRLATHRPGGLHSRPLRPAAGGPLSHRRSARSHLTSRRQLTTHGARDLPRQRHHLAASAKLRGRLGLDLATRSPRPRHRGGGALRPICRPPHLSHLVVSGAADLRRCLPSSSPRPGPSSCRNSIHRRWTSKSPPRLPW